MKFPLIKIIIIVIFKRTLKELKDPEKRLGRAAQINQHDKKPKPMHLPIKFPVFEIIQKLLQGFIDHLLRHQKVKNIMQYKKRNA